MNASLTLVLIVAILTQSAWGQGSFPGGGGFGNPGGSNGQPIVIPNARIYTTPRDDGTLGSGNTRVPQTQTRLPNAVFPTDSCPLREETSSDAKAAIGALQDKLSSAYQECSGGKTDETEDLVGQIVAGLGNAPDQFGGSGYVPINCGNYQSVLTREYDTIVQNPGSVPSDSRYAICVTDSFGQPNDGAPECFQRTFNQSMIGERIRCGGMSDVGREGAKLDGLAKASGALEKLLIASGKCAGTQRTHAAQNLLTGGIGVATKMLAFSAGLSPLSSIAIGAVGSLLSHLVNFKSSLEKNYERSLKRDEAIELACLYKSAEKFVLRCDTVPSKSSPLPMISVSPAACEADSPLKPVVTQIGSLDDQIARIRGAVVKKEVVGKDGPSSSWEYDEDAAGGASDDNPVFATLDALRAPVNVPVAAGATKPSLLWYLDDALKVVQASPMGTAAAARVTALQELLNIAKEDQPRDGPAGRNFANPEWRARFAKAAAGITAPKGSRLTFGLREIFALAASGEPAALGKLLIQELTLASSQRTVEEAKQKLKVRTDQANKDQEATIPKLGSYVATYKKGIQQLLEIQADDARTNHYRRTYEKLITSCGQLQAFLYFGKDYSGSGKFFNETVDPNGADNFSRLCGSVSCLLKPPLVLPANGSSFAAIQEHQCNQERGQPRALSDFAKVCDVNQKECNQPLCPNGG